MDIQLKQRLVGLTVIFSLAVIFLPMLLDGSGISRDRAPDAGIPPEPEIQVGTNVEELVIELDRKAEQLVRLEPVIVDEISDPPGEDSDGQDAPEDVTQESPPVQDVPAPREAEKTAETQTAPAEQPARKASPQPPPPQAAPAKAVPPVPVAMPDKEKKTGSETKPGGLLWVVQTGSFQEKDKAYKQRDRIRKSRLAPVFIEKYQHKGKLNYRVRMGPFLTRDEANVVRNKLRAKYNLRSILMKYEK